MPLFKRPQSIPPLQVKFQHMKVVNQAQRPSWRLSLAIVKEHQCCVYAQPIPEQSTFLESYKSVKN